MRRKLFKGFLGLMGSTKGTLCILMGLCAFILCFIGRLDGGSYALVMGSVVSVFCATQAVIERAWAGVSPGSE